MDIEKINVGGTQYDVCDTVARAALSDEFSTGGTYAVGDYCIYENTLYKFTAAKEPGAWDASKVAATQIGDELSELNGKIQSGTYTVPSGGNGEIIFDPPFSATPRLVLTSVGSATNIATAFKIKSINAAKAEILVMYVTNSGVEVANSQSDLHWIACES